MAQYASKIKAEREIAYARKECQDCWAKLYCSGGCAANSYHATGSITGVYEYGCELFKKRMECAIMIKVAENQELAAKGIEVPIERYAKSGTARLHMPGHKGQSLLGFEPLDITEICGADELYARRRALLPKRSQRHPAVWHGAQLLQH